MKRDRLDTASNGTGMAELVRAPGELHVVEHGSRTAPSMLFIHGTAGSSAWWDPVVAALAEHRHVVRVDLAGHGRSRPGRSYDVLSQATGLCSVLDDLGITTATVAGHSSGGFVATAMAEHRPDLVRDLVLINTGPHPGAFRPQGLLTRLASLPVLRRLTLRSDRLVRKGLRTAFTRPVEVPDNVVEAVRGMDYRALTNSPRLSLAYIAQRALPDRLADLGIRLLVIFGADDRRWRSSSAQEYDIVPNGRIEMLPHIGHSPMFEAPEITIRLLLEFAESSL
jgi:pimeloyl-ACP methyl ester carboxylesterase